MCSTMCQTQPEGNRTYHLMQIVGFFEGHVVREPAPLGKEKRATGESITSSRTAELSGHRELWMALSSSGVFSYL